MTPPEETAALERVLAEATPLPWQALVVDDEELLTVLQEDACAITDRVAGLIFTQAVPGANGHGQTLATINARRATLEQDKANAALIVAAVNALPALLALALRAEAAEKRVGELEAGLAPFAAIAAVDIGEDETDSDKYQPLAYNRAPHITIGHLRRARALITPIAEGR